MPLLFCKYDEEMKYPQLASSTTPASLQDWLEGELESRGIDGVYTRYILSLLQEDGTDIEPLECEHLFGEFGKPHWKQKESYHNLGKELFVPVSEKPRHYRLKSLEKERSYKGELYHCDCMVLLDSEERKKSVAVECLKSASEQKIGLEKLIDEVCAKLKKIRSMTGTESESTKEEDAKISLSSPQEQAEKYYAAFPALCGRLEPLTQLCQQQESTRAIMTVWDKKKIQRLLEEVNSSKHPSESIDLSDDEFGSDCDSSFDKQSDQSEKENEDGNIEHETQQPFDKETIPRKEKHDADYQPLFIVPKVKMSVHRIPFSVKCLPFNPNSIDQSKKLSIPNKQEVLITEIQKCGTEVKLQLPVASSDLDDKDNAYTTAESSNSTECINTEGEFDLPNTVFDDKAELNVLPYSTTLNISFAESFNNEDYAYNEFAGKFNNQLAAIWTQNDQSQPSNNFPLIFEVSLKENYLKAPCFSLQLLEKSINDIKSIWTVSQDDFKLMGANTSNLLPLTYFAANEALLTEQKDDGQQWEDVKNNDSFIDSFEAQQDNEDDSADDELPLPFLPVGFSKREDMIKDGSSSFVPWKDLSSGITPEKSGIYSLWTSTSSLALERSNGILSSALTHTLSEDYDSECHYEGDSHWSNNDNMDAIFVEEMPLNKSKCTLTYHKGESLFVEVIPSPKPAREISETSPYESDIIEHDTLHPVSSDSDDLLTSPKTHFQPIHQDSLDLDNGDDETMTLTLQTNSPAEECNFHNMIMLQKCTGSSPVEPLGENNRRASLEINDYERGRQNIYSSQRIHIESPYNNLLSFSKDNSENREKACSEPSTNFSGFPHVWSNSYYKEKATNTDTSSCGVLDCVDDYGGVNCTTHLIDSNRKYGLLSDSEDDIMLTVNDFLSLNDMPAKLDKWKWSTNDNNECWNLNENPSGRWENIENENDFICSKHTGKLDIRNNLEALKKEIEEEEEELFRDITRLNDETYDSDLDSPDHIFGNYYEYETKRFPGAKQWSTDTEVCEFSYDMYGCVKQELCCWESSLSEDYTDYEGSFRLCTSDVEGKSLFPSVPADKVVYSSDLEDEWRRSSHPFSISHGRKTKYKHRIAPQRKPCSFYLEGSCRRSDCKFSHDLGNITCRFWEEGSCFKGDTCPFLHGYLGDGFRRDCRHRKSNYVLESEADFPSLSTSVPQDFEKESPRDIPGKGSRRKKRRGKIQHGLMISSSWPQQKGNNH